MTTNRTRAALRFWLLMALAMYAQIGGQRLTVTDADGGPLGDSPILISVQVE